MACPPGTPSSPVYDSLHYVTGGGQFVRILHASGGGGDTITTDNQFLVARPMDSTDPWYPTVTLTCNGVVGTGLNSVDHVEWSVDYGGGIVGYQSTYPGFTGQIKAMTAIEGDTVSVYLRVIGGNVAYPYNTDILVVERADFEYWFFDGAAPAAVDVGVDSAIKVLSIGAGGTPPAGWQLRSFDDSAWDDPLGSVRPHNPPLTGRIWPPSNLLGGGILTLISEVAEIALGRHTFRLGSDTPGTPPPPPPNPTSVDSIALTVEATTTLLAIYLDDVALTIPTPTAIDYERNEYVFTLVPSAINLSSPVHVLAVEVEANPSGVILGSNNTGEIKAHGGMDWLLEITSCAASVGGGGYYQIG